MQKMLNVVYIINAIRTFAVPTFIYIYRVHNTTVIDKINLLAKVEKQSANKLVCEQLSQHTIRAHNTTPCE